MSTQIRKRGGVDVEKQTTKPSQSSISATSGSPSMSNFLRAAGVIFIVGIVLFGFNLKNSAKLKYAVVIDAGSTGSRIHAYEFSLNGGEPKLKNELFVQLKPGLSSFASNPQEGARSLEPLLKQALDKIPSGELANTPIMLGATAGLRMLPGSQAEDLLEHSRNLIRNSYSFKPIADTDVSIMGGDDEGKFAWLAVNMLIGKLGKSYQETVGVVDLGGGSVQMMRALDPKTVAGAPSGYILNTKWQEKKYDLYVNSWPYGLKAGRLATFKKENSVSACIPDGVSDSFKYKGETIELSGSSSANFDGCHKKVIEAMEVDKPCEADSGCAFAGKWGGLPNGGTEFYLLSYLYERVEQAGIGKFEPDEGIGEATVGELAAAAKKVCSMSLEQLKAATDMHPEDPTYFCMDLSYIYSLLTSGLGITNSFKMAKKFEINDVKYEAAWSLGAALEML
mmetsp:Transcript_2420/g.3476  ORF Transcript_2420/g.3476 Transcript_2420/m.3476 type:complete len:451 (+) Transcript_2420:45-1397(+)